MHRENGHPLYCGTSYLECHDGTCDSLFEEYKNKSKSSVYKHLKYEVPGWVLDEERAEHPGEYDLATKMRANIYSTVFNQGRCADLLSLPVEYFDIASIGDGVMAEREILINQMRARQQERALKSSKRN